MNWKLNQNLKFISFLNFGSLIFDVDQFLRRWQSLKLEI